MSILRPKQQMEYINRRGQSGGLCRPDIKNFSG